MTEQTLASLARTASQPADNNAAAEEAAMSSFGKVAFDQLTEMVTGQWREQFGRDAAVRMGVAYGIGTLFQIVNHATRLGAISPEARLDEMYNVTKALLKGDNGPAEELIAGTSKLEQKVDRTFREKNPDLV